MGIKVHIQDFSWRPATVLNPVIVTYTLTLTLMVCRIADIAIVERNDTVTRVLQQKRSRQGSLEATTLSAWKVN